MNEFTKEEMLCKQVAEKHRKNIKRGDWYNDLNVGDGNLDICNFNQGVYWTYLNKNKKVIPLWTISDCLEFLRRRGHIFVFHDLRALKGNKIKLPTSLILGKKTFGGNTPLEACLKAVLAVLEDKK